MGESDSRKRGEVIQIANALRALILDSILKTAETIPDTPLHSRGADRPSRAWILRPEKQRAWGMPGAQCTRSLACKMEVSTRA
jgi:hypothetical protein